jgi:hypothetical protein
MGTKRIAMKPAAETGNVGPQDATLPIAKAAGTLADSCQLTRTAVATLLNTSTSTVRRMEGSVLHPLRGPDGVNVFSRDEVLQLALKRASESGGDSFTPGQLAAAAFRLFKQGSRVCDVVIALERTPEEVSKLFSQWTNLHDQIVLSPETIAKLDRLAEANLISEDLVVAVETDDAQALQDYFNFLVEHRRAASR